MQLLKANSRMLCKCCMLVVCMDLGLEKYIARDAKFPKSIDRVKPTAEEQAIQKHWIGKDAKARTRIELAIRDSKMIHLTGAETACEMWDQLVTVKEFKGRLRVLETCHALYRATAKEGFKMVDHISKLRQLQDKLHIMDNKVPDEDFVMIFIHFFLNHGTIVKPLTLDQVVINHWFNLMNLSQFYWKKTVVIKESTDKECFNWKKEGHMAKDCWAK